MIPEGPSNFDWGRCLAPGEERLLAIPVGTDELCWKLTGPTATGPEVVLLENDDDLTAATGWHDVGFTVADFFDDAECSALERGTTELVCNDLRELGHDLPADFDLAHYHRLISDDEAHLALIRRRNSYFPIADLPIAVTLVEERLSELLGATVSTLSPTDVPASFGVRIVRPRSRDNNPPHRDAWLERLRNSITIYVPLFGSTPRSSLTLVPGSHRWKESHIEHTLETATVDGVSYSVPSVAAAAHPLEFVRPDPARGQVLVFSPYLIHGGARNLEADSTRVSLELRFERTR